MTVDSKLCVACNALDEKKECAVCRRQLKRDSFSKNSWDHWVAVMRCKACHTCVSCKQEKHSRAFDGKGAECVLCAGGEAERWICAACEKELPAASFDAKVLKNAKFRPSARVCLSCKERGFSPKDVQAYRCVECELDKGHTKFDSQALKHFKKNRSKELVCSDCYDRHKRIEKVLKQKGALNCTCRGKAGHLHSNEKCDLFPEFNGKRKWPGMNLAVTWDDWQFCENMRKRQKK